MNRLGPTRDHAKQAMARAPAGPSPSSTPCQRRRSALRGGPRTHCHLRSAPTATPGFRPHAQQRRAADPHGAGARAPRRRLGVPCTPPLGLQNAVDAMSRSQWWYWLCPDRDCGPLGRRQVCAGADEMVLSGPKGPKHQLCPAERTETERPPAERTSVRTLEHTIQP